jgi:hypothetical protein
MACVLLLVAGSSRVAHHRQRYRYRQPSSYTWTHSPTAARPDTLLVEVIAMTMREALDKAMGRDSADGAMAALQEGGIAMANEDTMSQAIHDVYCGIMADHQHPNDKDRDQARQLIAALERQLSV